MNNKKKLKWKANKKRFVFGGKSGRQKKSRKKRYRKLKKKLMENKVLTLEERAFMTRYNIRRQKKQEKRQERLQKRRIE